MHKTHVCTYRVSYGDTDKMDRVYYANYLEICERARTEFLRSVGHPYRALEEQGLYFPVRSVQLRYHAGAQYDDLLECVSCITRMSHATLTIQTLIQREGQPLVTASVELACIGANWKPRVLPPELRAALEPYVAPKE